MTYKTYKRTGFTLIEMLVVVGIIAVIGTLLSQVFFATTRSNTKVEVQSEVKQVGDYTLEVMSRMIRNAQSATCDISSSSLTLINADGGTSTFQCHAVGDVLQIASESAGKVDYLTSNAVTIRSINNDGCISSKLSFTCSSTTPTSVQISFSLVQKGTPADQFEKSSISFQTSATMRNSE